MYIIRRKLYSDDDDNNKKKRRRRRGFGGGISIGAGLGYVSSKLVDKANSGLIDSVSKSSQKFSEGKESKELYDKFLKDARNKNIQIYERDGFGASFQPQDKKRAKETKQLLDHYRKTDAKAYEGTVKEIIEGRRKKPLGIDNALVLGRKTKDPAILAHELGHAHYYMDKNAGVVGKAAHKLRGNFLFNDVARNKYTPMASGIIGFKHGIEAERMKKEGKEESTLHRVAPTAASALISAPILISEAAASTRGHRMLRNSGASEELLKEAKRTLGKAWGTYGLRAAAPVVTSEGGRLAGKIYERNRKED